MAGNSLYKFRVASSKGFLNMVRTNQGVRAMAIRFKKLQLHALNAAFEESEHLSKQKKMELVRITGLDVEQVTSWFNRERAKRRARESREDLKRKNAQLQESLREGEEREAELEKQLQETKKRKAELEAENWNLKQELGMDGCYSQCDHFLMFVKELDLHGIRSIEM